MHTYTNTTIIFSVSVDCGFTSYTVQYPCAMCNFILTCLSSRDKTSHTHFSLTLLQCLPWPFYLPTTISLYHCISPDINTHTYIMLHLTRPSHAKPTYAQMPQKRVIANSFLAHTTTLFRTLPFSYICYLSW